MASLSACCAPCAKGRSSEARTDAAASASASSSTVSSAEPAAADSTPRVRGVWAGRPFEAGSAVADVYPRWVTITIYNRKLTCASTALRPDDMAVQLTVPSGPSGDFFASHDLALPIQLSGAGGVSAIPSGNVSVRIDDVRIGNGSSVRGRIEMRFVPGADEGAPRYELAGPFDAMVCSAQPTTPSMPDVDRSQSPIRGEVAGRSVKFPTVLAYVRDDADGKPILVFKGYTRNVECHSVDRATPFLLGVEVGPGMQGDYHAGALMPAAWVLQMSDGHSGERSVHADDGAGLIQIDSAETHVGGVVRGSLAAMTLEETDPALKYSVAGSFTAKVCGKEQRAW